MDIYVCNFWCIILNKYIFVVMDMLREEIDFVIGMLISWL